ncbi:MAG: hypothetical protein LBE35_09745 [Clostridiales bacterium]|jgi:predicted RNA-binding Zn-ribbon protein involved in translation (DUF1610 family)|nr:hypothetical protein [Clostridiales bacterium]
MRAKDMVIEGEYEGLKVSLGTHDKKRKAHIILKGWGAGYRHIDNTQVESYTLVSETDTSHMTARLKNAAVTQSVRAGNAKTSVGSDLHKITGSLSSIAANRQTGNICIVAVKWRNGGTSLLEIQDAYYQAIVANCFSLNDFSKNLIQCASCGHSVSTKANSCPQCGDAEIKRYVQEQQQVEQANLERDKAAREMLGKAASELNKEELELLEILEQRKAEDKLKNDERNARRENFLKESEKFRKADAWIAQLKCMLCGGELSFLGKCKSCKAKGYNIPCPLCGGKLKHEFLHGRNIRDCSGCGAPFG